MIKAIFFDLDGTLINMDEKTFFKIYLKSYCSYFKEKFTFEQIKDLFIRIETQLNGIPLNSNLEKINFLARSFMNEEEYDWYLKKTYEYYESSLYDECKIAVNKKEGIEEVLSLIRSEELPIIVATNPYFPRAAVEKRMTWGGLNFDDFDYVTLFTNSRFCKPDLRYYSDLLDRFNFKPSEVLMIGNDVEEDMCASKLGINTYLLKENLISRFSKEDEIENSGYVNDLYKYLKENICK